MTPREKALLLIDCIEKALARGVKHYNATGTELETPLEILDCLIKEGSIKCEDPTIMQEMSNLLKN